VFAGEAWPATPDESNQARALQLCREGNYLEALDLATQDLRSAELRFGPSAPEVVGEVTALAQVYRWQGRLQDAETYYQRALAILEEAHGPGCWRWSRSAHRWWRHALLSGRGLSLYFPSC